MNFPTYVPLAVADFIRDAIYGEKLRHGWDKSLKCAEARVVLIEAEYNASKENSDHTLVEDLRIKLVRAKSHVRGFQEEIACLKRLACDPRMEKVYELLSPKSQVNDQSCGFIRSAFASKIDYGQPRSKLESAKELSKEIAKQAKKLSKLIDKYSDTGIMAPDEFYSIPAILAATDNHESDGRNFDIWQSMRKYILGDRDDIDNLQQKSPKEYGDIPTTYKMIAIKLGEKTDITPDETRRNMLRYGWNAAPNLPALLDTLADVASAFDPEAGGVFDAAIASRKRNTYAEYVRAFRYNMHHNHQMLPTVAIMKAMAITANVVLNGSDMDVTYDDVRKALKQVS
jgi:hypothetical protein